MSKKKRKVSKARQKPQARASTRATDLYARGATALRQNAPDSAEHAFRELLQIAPNHTDGLHDLGALLLARRDYNQALELFRAAAANRPGDAHIRNSIGAALLNLGDLDAATSEILEALRIDPTYADAHAKLGSVLHKSNRINEAIYCFNKAIELDPTNARAYNNLGNALRAIEDYRGALECYKKVLDLTPTEYSIYNNMAIALQHLRKYEDAARALVESLKYNPNSFEAYANLSDVLKYQGKFGAAREAIQVALTLSPDNPKLLWNISLIELAQGALSKGWEHYKSGVDAGTRVPTDFGVQHWDGSSLEGNTIVVCAEQGIGDEIFFASCIPDLLPITGRLVINCDARLAPLYRRSFPSAEIYPGRNKTGFQYNGSLPHLDYQVPLGELPLHFRKELNDFPTKPGYLQADPDAISAWRQSLAALGPELKIGINWRTGLRKVSRHSDCTLEDFLPILQTPGFQFINLQYDNCDDELEELYNNHGITIHNFDNIDQFNDIDGVAALISALDLVICPGTAVSRIAGAVGTPTYCLLHNDTWTLLGTGSEPWFPNTQIFMSEVHGVWEKAIRDLANRLQADWSESE